MSCGLCGLLRSPVQLQTRVSSHVTTRKNLVMGLSVRVGKKSRVLTSRMTNMSRNMNTLPAADRALVSLVIPFPPVSELVTVSALTTGTKWVNSTLRLSTMPT